MVVEQKLTKEEQERIISEFFKSWNGFVSVPVEDIVKKVKFRVSLKNLFKPEEYAKLCRYEKKRIRKIGRNLTIMMYLDMPNWKNVQNNGLPLPNENELRAKIGLLPRGSLKQMAISDSDQDVDDDDWKPWKRSKKKQGMLSVTDIMKRQQWLAKKCHVENEEHDEAIVIPEEFKGPDYEKDSVASGTKKVVKAKTKPELAVDRYPKRELRVVKYKDPNDYKEDDFLYCDDCDKLYLGDCEVHGPYKPAPDAFVKKGLVDRAQKTSPDGISIAMSGIRSGGLGAWCDKGFSKNTVFGPYEGKAVHRNDVAKLSRLFEGGYAWEIYKKGKLSHYIDGEDTKQSNWMRYINCACFEEQQNVIAYQYQGDIYYRLYKDITPGTELLVWYGDQYAQSLGIPTEYKTKCVQLETKPEAVRKLERKICLGNLFV